MSGYEDILAIFSDNQIWSGNIRLSNDLQKWIVDDCLFFHTITIVKSRLCTPADMQCGRNIRN